MSSAIGTFDISLPENNRSLQISDLDEPDIYSDQFRPYSFIRNKYLHDRSFNDYSLRKRSSIVPELHIPYSNDHQYINISNNTYQLCSMIIGSPKYKEIIKTPYELFKLFFYTFGPSNTVNDFIKNIFDLSTFTETKIKIRPSVCVLYQNQRLDGKEYLSMQSFQSNLIVYILLIPTNTNEISCEGSLEFYNPRSLSHSSDVYVRVSQINTISRIIRIKNVEKDTTIKTLKQRVWEILKINKVCRQRIYYYGYELFDDVCPLAPHFGYFIDPEKLPVIFDLVLTGIQATIPSDIAKEDKQLMCSADHQLPSIHLNILSDIGNKLNIYYNDDDNNPYETHYETFFRNFALIYYVRLCIYVAVSNRNSGENTGELIRSINPDTIENSKTNDREFDKVLSDFYSFCDKDKSGKLNEGQWTMGLLTLFKYINEDIIENKLSAKNLLPIVYHNDQTIENEYCNKQDFQTLIIDTLTEHIRIQTFQGPEYSHIKQSIIQIDKEIEDLSKGIQNTLTEHLKLSNESDDKSPFSVGETIRYILLFLLSFIFLPITIFILLRIIIRKEKSPLICQSQPLRIIISILIIFCTFVVYLIIINIILYHMYYKDNYDWRVNALEVYWPFALIIYMILMCYLYLSEEVLLNRTDQKRREIEKSHNDAEIEMLKHRIKVTTINGKRMTVAEFESIEGLLSNSNETTFNKKSILTKLKNFFNKIYKIEFKNRKIYFIMLKIVGLVLLVGIGVCHTCIPLIFRSYFSNKNEPNTTKPFQVELIKISYFIVGLPLYLIFLLMIIYAFYKYKILYCQINELLQKTTNNCEYHSSTKNKYYFNLKNPDHLDLFLGLLRQQVQMNKKIEYRIGLASVYVGLIFDLILTIVSVIRLLYYGFGTLNTLTSAFLLIDILILSILITFFLLGISSINTTTTTEVFKLILRTKKEALIGTFRDSKTDKHWNINYLSAMNEYLVANRELYSINLFGFTIDQSLVLKLLITMLVGVASSAFSLIQKRLDNID